MTGDDPCPRCGAPADEVSMVDPTEDVWLLDPDDYGEDAKVWLCVRCNWNEEATFDEELDELDANLAWIMERIVG